jgi:hypothetical protein
LRPYLKNKRKKQEEWAEVWLKVVKHPPSKKEALIRKPQYCKIKKD